MIFNGTNLDVILNYLFTILLAGKSTALAEEVEAKEKELEKKLEELKENEEERRKVDEENSHFGDIDSPHEEASRQELID